MLSSVAVPVQDSAKPIVKPKERCKFYPLCNNATCAFYHPTLPCKSFPNCKFGDSCAYVHPRCKFDTSCARVDCNFSHSQSVTGLTLPPIGELLNHLKRLKSEVNLTLVYSIISCSREELQIHQHPAQHNHLQVFPPLHQHQLRLSPSQGLQLRQSLHEQVRLQLLPLRVVEQEQVQVGVAAILSGQFFCFPFFE